MGGSLSVRMPYALFVYSGRGRLLLLAISIEYIYACGFLCYYKNCVDYAKR